MTKVTPRPDPALSALTERQVVDGPMLFAIEREATITRNAEIRAAQERVIAVFRKKPTAAFTSVQASGHVGDGLTCRSQTC